MSGLLTVGIVIDAWKLQIFDRRLTGAGFTYEKKDGPGPNILSLIVLTNNRAELVKVVVAANAEAARTGTPHER